MRDPDRGRFGESAGVVSSAGGVLAGRRERVCSSRTCQSSSLRVPNIRLQLGHFTGIRISSPGVEPLLSQPNVPA
jgi:hypothetical protein